MTLLGLSARNVLRNRLRTVLTIVGVAIAILSFVMLRTTIAAWKTGADHAAQDRLATWHRVSFVIPLPKRYIDEFDPARQQFEGVTATTYLNWFGGKHPTRENEFFATLAVDPATFFTVYSEMEVADDQLSTWKENLRGAIVGEALAKQFGWEVGDTVTLSGTIYPGDWQFQIDGIYRATKRSVDRAQFLFHWKYLNENIPEAMRDQIGWIASTIEDPSRSAEISQAIDAVFEEKEVPTQTMTERALNMQFLGAASAILTAMDIVSAVILAIMLLILGNTIAMSVRERTHEYGVLLAVGFRPRHIGGFIIGEGIAIGLLGGVCGLILAYPLVEKGLGRFLEENMGSYFPYFRVPLEVSVLALIICAVLGALAAGIPAYRASRLNAVEALRRLG